MKGLKLSLFVGFLFYASKVCLYGAGFELPAGTPGLDQNDIQMGNVNCKHVHIPNTNCHLYFPTDGSQPDTPQAGQWSGVGYVGMPNDDLVTDWWVEVFGGDGIVNAHHRPPRGNACNIAGFFFLNFFGNLWNNVLPGNRVLAHIISVNTNIRGTPQNFEQRFWQAFREIADDPVGRVLLYRLLIEIQRIDDTGDGCCGDDVVLPIGYDPGERNDCRSIEVINSNNGCAFDPYACSIRFDLGNIQTLTLHGDPATGGMTGQPEWRPRHVALFHEMTHWLHWLRNNKRVVDNMDPTSCMFKYAMRCYYGDQTELGIWDSNCNSEEIATILGAPNYNRADHLALIPTNAYFSILNRGRNSITVNNNGIQSYIPHSEQFLNGDDLSENVYRCSKGLYMRFGHTDFPANPVSLLNPPLHYRLAHKVAVDCYIDITGHPPANWQLRAGGAINR